MSGKRGSKNGKPRSLPEQTRRLWAQFGPEDRVLVAIAADPDSMASALALKRLLWRRVASVTIARVNEMTRPDNLAMARVLKIPMEPLSSIKVSDFSKLVMVDSQPQHNEVFADLKPQVIIDHHPAGEAAQKAAYTDIRPRYGANSTIMTEYLRGARIKVSTRLATALTFGIKNDTAGFQRPSLEEDVKAFQFVFPKANQTALRKIEYSEMRVKDLDILRLALDVVQVRKNCMFAHLGHVSRPDNLVQIADFFLKVDTVDTSAVSGVFQDTLVVILRSSGLRQNAGKQAEEAFGHMGSAGGHKSMARAEIHLKDLEELLGSTDEESLRRFVVRQIQKPRHREKKKSQA